MKGDAMRDDVTVHSSGFELAGWFYPSPIVGRQPAILMSHGLSAVKEQGLHEFATSFNDAGFAVLVIDYRCLGASSGAERGRIVPNEQHDDLRASLAWLGQRDDVDAERLGMWGTSFSGGHAMFIGGLDPRVKVVVAQVPAIDVAGTLVSLSGEDGFRGVLGMLAADHATRNAGGEGAAIPIVAPAGEVSMLPTPDSYEFFTGPGSTPNWLNLTSLESVARSAEYKPAAFIDLIAPRPLLIQAAERDSIIPIAQVRDAFARAGEPKRLDVHNCGHFEFYPGGAVHGDVVRDATEWFVKHL
ncbi:MAG: alpha/beta hydrolase [Ilumatobacteraceae bacterium]